MEKGSLVRVDAERLEGHGRRETQIKAESECANRAISPAFIAFERSLVGAERSSIIMKACATRLPFCNTCPVLHFLRHVVQRPSASPERTQNTKAMPSCHEVKRAHADLHDYNYDAHAVNTVQGNCVSQCGRSSTVEVVGTARPTADSQARDALMAGTRPQNPLHSIARCNIRIAVQHVAQLALVSAQR